MSRDVGSRDCDRCSWLDADKPVEEPGLFVLKKAECSMYPYVRAKKLHHLANFRHRQLDSVIQIIGNLTVPRCWKHVVLV